jgi:hypothetical protein
MLGSRVTIKGRLRHELAKQEIASADVLVNAVTEERQQVIGISSKFYEYAAARKPIIAINPTRSDRLLLRELAAIVIEKPSLGTLVAALRKALTMQPAEVAQSYRKFLEEQSWPEHCRRLGIVLDSVTQKPRRAVDFRELEIEELPQPR